MESSCFCLKTATPKLPTVGIWAELEPENSVLPILLLPWLSFGKGWTPCFL